MFLPTTAVKLFIMPRTITRAHHMRSSATIRLTEKDKAELKLHAQRKGLDVSSFIREVLIQANIITPLG